MDLRIYLNLEYMYPGMTKEKGRSKILDRRQIVQIAAILFENTIGIEVESFNVLTFPTYDRVLPDFFQDLTGITQEALEKEGVPLFQGVCKFLDFTRSYPIYTFHSDDEVLAQNCEYIFLQFPFGKKFIRVRDLLSRWGVDPDKYSFGTLYQAVGLEMSGHVHNALYDVRSMAAAVHILEKRK